MYPKNNVKKKLKTHSTNIPVKTEHPVKTMDESMRQLFRIELISLAGFLLFTADTMLQAYMIF